MAIMHDRIKELRNRKGMTLAQIADALGTTEATAQRYESGKGIKSIPYDVIEKYANIFGCKPQYIVGWEEEKNKTKQDTMTIGDFFEYLRNQRNLSVAEFAEETGLTESVIKSYESGAGGIPVEIVKMLADYFNISSGKLIAGKVKEKDIFAAFASTNEAYVEQVTKWVETFGNEKFSDEEFSKIIEYAKFLLYQRMSEK